MHTRTEQTWLYWLISPFVWAIFSIGIFLVSFFFPPFTYQVYIHDPYYGYLNWNSAAFTGLCILAMLFGWWVFNKIAPKVKYDSPQDTLSRSPVTLVDLFVGMILLSANIIFLAVIIKSGGLQKFQTIGQSTEAMAAYYEEILASVDASGLGSLMQISAIVIPWFYWLRIQASQAGSGSGKLIASGLFWSH
ncbi:MAG: hypothetical protein R3C11_13015 [Planctomycetaceae bacterium]